VTAGGERDGLLVVHRHAREGQPHVLRGAERVGLAADALGVDVDEAHLDRGERVLERLADLAVVAVEASHSFSEPQ
jgi:hypothetical protein